MLLNYITGYFILIALLVTYVIYLTNNQLEVYLEKAATDVNSTLSDSNPPIVYVTRISQSSAAVTTINTVDGKRINSEQKEEDIAKFIQYFYR